MKRVLSMALALILVLTFAITAAAVPYMELIDAESVLLIDMDTGEVIHSVDETKRVYPAGTTKLMTALVAYELCEDVDASFEIPPEALDGISEDSDKTLNPILAAGETVTMRDILGGILIGSGNDAASVAAYYTAGSVEKFVEHMNTKAAELGMTGTNYTNPHGRNGEEHYTTAADMGKLMKVIYNTPTLMSVLDQPSFVFCDGTSSERVLNSGNLFYTGNDVIKYSSGTASFGGYTDVAGGCLVAGAEKYDTRLLCMVFGTPNSEDTWIIAKKLFEYAYNRTVKYTGDELLGGIELPAVERMTLTPDFTGITIEVSKYFDVSNLTVKVEPPMDEESDIGSAKYYASDGSLIAIVPVTFTELEPPAILKVLKVLLIVILVILLLAVLAFVVLKLLQLRHEREKVRRKAIKEQQREEMLEEQRQNIDYSEFTDFDE